MPHQGGRQHCQDEQEREHRQELSLPSPQLQTRSAMIKPILENEELQDRAKQEARPFNTIDILDLAQVARPRKPGFGKSNSFEEVMFHSRCK